MCVCVGGGKCSSSVISQYLIQLKFIHMYQSPHQHLLIKMLMNCTSLCGSWVSHWLLLVKAVPLHGRLKANFPLNPSAYLQDTTHLYRCSSPTQYLINFEAIIPVHYIYNHATNDFICVWCRVYYYSPCKKCKLNDWRRRVYPFVLLSNLLLRWRVCGCTLEVVHWLVLVRLI
jgi:hypothetical protein